MYTFGWLFLNGSFKSSKSINFEKNTPKLILQYRLYWSITREFDLFPYATNITRKVGFIVRSR